MATPPTSAPPSGAQTSSRTAAHSLARYREEFPIFRDKIYLNTCSLGALGERTRRKLAEFVDLWQSRGASAWYDVWWAALGDLRRRYGSPVGAAAAVGGRRRRSGPGVGAARGETPRARSIWVALWVGGEAVDYPRRPKVVVTSL